MIYQRPLRMEWLNFRASVWDQWHVIPVRDHICYGEELNEDVCIHKEPGVMKLQNALLLKNIR